MCIYIGLFQLGHTASYPKSLATASGGAAAVRLAAPCILNTLLCIYGALFSAESNSPPCSSKHHVPFTS